MKTLSLAVLLVTVTIQFRPLPSSLSMPLIIPTYTLPFGSTTVPYLPVRIAAKSLSKLFIRLPFALKNLSYNRTTIFSTPYRVLVDQHGLTIDQTERMTAGHLIEIHALVSVVGLTNHEQRTILDDPHVLNHTTKHATIIPNATEAITNVVLFHRQTLFIVFHRNHASILHLVSAFASEKNQSKKRFCLARYLLCRFCIDFGTRFALACHFGRKRAPPAILADSLPFWLLAQILLLLSPLSGESNQPVRVGKRER